jgi:acyl transferase domain-containing protein
VVVPLAGLGAQGEAALIRVARAHRGATGTLASRAAAALRRARWGSARQAIVAADLAALDAALAEVQPAQRRMSRVALVAPGPGSQRAAMGLAIAAREPVFGAAWGRCRDTFAGLGVDLEASVAAGRVDQIDAAQQAAFAFGYAAWSWLVHLGISAEAWVGHSGGEILAAHAAGVLTFEDAIALVVARGRAMREQPHGGMLAAFAEEGAVRDVLERSKITLALAAVNAPSQTVWSGAAAAIEAARQELAAAGLPVHVLPVGTAAHSPWMAPVAEEIRKVMAPMELAAPRTRWISSLTCRAQRRVDRGYFAEQILGPVRFAGAIEAAIAEGIDGFIELGATAGLTACVESIAGERAVAIALGSAREDETTAALTGIAAAWTAGLPVRLDRLSRPQDGPPARLVPWPWARRRLWIDTFEAPPSRGRVVAAGLPSIADHRTGGTITAPAALLVDWLLAEVGDGATGAGLTRVVVERPLAFGPGEAREIEIVRDGSRIALASRGAGDRTHLVAQVVAEPPRTFDRVDLAAVRARCRREVAPSALYELLGKSGFVVGPRMRGVAAVRAADAELVADLETPPGGDRGRWIDPALLDGASQAVAALFVGGPGSPRPFLGFSIGSLSVWSPVSGACVAMIRLRAAPSAGSSVVRYDLLLCDRDGRILAEVIDFAAKRAEEAAPAVDPGRSQAPRPVDDEVLERIRREVAARVRRPEASIPLDDNLARLGLDSLKAVAVVAALEAHYGLRLPATLLFEVRTLREAARVVRELIEGGSS